MDTVVTTIRWMCHNGCLQKKSIYMVIPIPRIPSKRYIYPLLGIGTHKLVSKQSIFITVPAIGTKISCKYHLILVPILPIDRAQLIRMPAFSCQGRSLASQHAIGHPSVVCAVFRDHDTPLNIYPRKPIRFSISIIPQTLKNPIGNITTSIKYNSRSSCVMILLHHPR
jgi:hypothetical protein